VNFPEGKFTHDESILPYVILKPMEEGETIQGVVEKLVFGGQGLIRHKGMVVFVADVVPGEEVIVRITQKKRSYLVATLEQVVTQVPFRIQPKCSYFGVCGGCQLQHIAYTKQLEFKQQMVQEALRLEHPIEIVPAQKQFAYRRKISLHAREGKTGYYARDNVSLVAIDHCPIFTEESLVPFQNSLDGTIMKRPDGSLHRIKEGCDKEGCFEEEVDGLKIYTSPRVFLQNYPEQSLLLYHDVLAIMKRLAPKAAVLDLYCGVGILSLLAARQGHNVVGIECNKQAVKCAKKSALTNGCRDVTFVAGMVEQQLLREVKKRAFDVWIVNPPRQGLSEQVIDHILACQPPFLIMISCMPPTLARDLKKLAMYEMVEIKAYDMFPQTTHVETMVVLHLTPPRESK